MIFQHVGFSQIQAVILFQRGFVPAASQEVCHCTHLLSVTGINRHFFGTGLTQTWVQLIVNLYTAALTKNCHGICTGK